MALGSIDGVLIEEANRLDGEVMRNKMLEHPWTALMDKGVWPEHLGTAISATIYEPTRYSALTWTNVGGTNSGNAVNPAVSTIASAKTLTDYQLAHVALHSEKLNVQDLMSSALPEDQLMAIYDNLGDNAQYLMGQRARAEYIRLAANTVVLDSATAPTEGSPTTAAVFELSNSALAKFRQRMLRVGGGNRPMAKVDGKPIFGLVCDSEVSDALKAEMGENLRFDGRSNELLAPFGVEGIYKNFMHICDDLAPRYTFSGGVYTEVLPFSTTSATFGTKLQNNTSYETAGYTASIILHQDVCELLFPPAKTSGEAAGVSFDAKDYQLSAWEWVNVRNMDSSSGEYNPDNQIGFFRGRVKTATKPRRTILGYVIYHLRPGFTG